MLVCLNNQAEIKEFLSMIYKKAIQYVRNESNINFASLDKNLLPNSTYLKFAKFKKIVSPCMSDSTILGSNIKLFLELGTYTNIRSYLLKKYLKASTLDAYCTTIRRYIYSYPYYSTDFHSVGYYIFQYIIDEMGIEFFSPSISSLFRNFNDTWTQSIREIISYLRSIYGVTSDEVIFEKRLLDESSYFLYYLSINSSYPASRFMDFFITKYGSYYIPNYDYTMHKNDNIVSDLYILFVNFFEALYSCMSLDKYSSTYHIIIEYLLPKYELLTTDLIESKLKYLSNYSYYVNNQLQSILYNIQDENFKNVGSSLGAILILAFPISVAGGISVNLLPSGTKNNNDLIRYSEYNQRYQVSYSTFSNVNFEFGCLSEPNATELNSASSYIPFAFCIPINVNTSSISSVTVSITAFSNTSKKIYSESRTANISLDSMRRI